MDVSENKKTLIGLVVALGALIVLVLVMSGTENGKYQMIADPSGTRVLILNTRNAELTMCRMPYAGASPNFAGSECRTGSIPTKKPSEKSE